MVLLAQLVVEYAADLAKLESGTQRVLDLMQSVGNAAQQPDRLGQGFVRAAGNVASFSGQASNAVASSSSLASAQAKAAVAADRVGVAQAQAALAVKKVADMETLGKASAEKIALAQAQAALAADKVKVAEASAALAMEKVESVGRGLASTMETDTAQTNRLAETFTHLQHSVASVHIQIPNVGSSLLDLGNKLGGTITAVQGLYQGAVNLGKGLLMPNASMEQLKVGFTTLLGSAQKAGDYLVTLQNFADSTPFEMPQVADAAQKLIAMGTAAKDVIPTLTDVGDAMAGLGKGADDVNRVVLVFGQMRAAGKVSAQDMMQLTDQGIPAWKYLADAMHKTIPEVQALSSKGLIPAEKGIEALRLGMHKTFGGDMAAQADTFLGRLSTLQDKAGAAMRAFTGPLFDEAKGALTWLGNKVASPEFQKFAKMLGEDIGGALKNIGKFIDQMKPGFNHFLDLMGQAGKIINDTGFKDFVASLQRLGDTVNQILVQPFVKWLQGIFTDKNILAGASNLGGAFHNLAGSLDWLNGVLKDGKKAWDQIYPIIAQIAGFLNGEFITGWKQIGDEWNNNVGPAWDDMNKAMHDSLPMLDSLNKSQLPLLASFFLLLGEGLVKFAIGVALGFAGLVESVSGFVGAMVAGWTVVYDILTGNWDKIPKDMENLKNNTGHIIHGMVLGVIGNFDMMTGPISASLDHLTGTTTDKMQNMSDKVVGHSIIPDMCNNIISWFQGLGPRAFDALQSFASNVTKSIQDLAGKAFDWGKGIVDNVVRGISSVPGNIGGALSLGGLHVPHLATGIENFSGGLAVVHAGEVLTNLAPGTSVIPARNVSATPQRARSGGTSGNGEVHIHNHLYLDKREMAMTLMEVSDSRVKSKYGVKSR